MKTKVTDFLRERGIAYRILPHQEPVYTVEAAAAQRGVVLEEMVKSILLRDRRGQFVMACVTGMDRVDPKAVRACLPAGWRRLSFASAEQILKFTGYHQGSVAPLCLPEEIPVLFDKAIAKCVKVNISSGDPMAGIELATEDLIKLAEAKIVPIAELRD